MEITRKRMTITFDVLPPHLVVEVVSPGQSNRDRDYDRKRRQYAARGICEYWLLDPEEEAITVLQLDEGNYLEVGRFTESMLSLFCHFPGYASSRSTRLSRRIKEFELIHRAN